MATTVTLTLIISIVILAIDGLDPFGSLASNPHPAIGLVTIVCAFIQPIMAAFRPHPGTRSGSALDFGVFATVNLGLIQILSTLIGA